jgi:hypothetical protein
MNAPRRVARRREDDHLVPPLLQLERRIDDEPLGAAEAELGVQKPDAQAPVGQSGFGQRAARARVATFMTERTLADARAA